MNRIWIFLSLLFVGCGSNSGIVLKNIRPYPVEIWVEDSFKPDEERAIVKAMGNWEKATGVNIFSYRGHITDNKFTIYDVFDKRHVVYKIERPIKMGALNVCESDKMGYCWSKSDILICWNSFRYHHKTAGRRELLRRLESTTTHELGHFIGLKHDDDPNSIMYPFHGMERKIQPTHIKQFIINLKKERL